MPETEPPQDADTPTSEKVPPERLHKFLARSGVASRRHAEELIAAGAVSVNGMIVRTQGVLVHPDQDVVCINDQRVRPLPAICTVAVHKPVGYISTAHDPQHRPIVSDLLPADLRRQRLVPVGRLDADSEGLLLLSNDGALTLRLTHPRYETEKEYHALVQGEVSDAALAQLQRGVVLAGGNPQPTAPARAWRLPHSAPLGHTWIAVALREGRKRQVRLMFAAVGARVVRLIRVRIGQLLLAEVVPAPGSYKTLTAHEIEQAQNT
jgi:pseudouridine synthase